ncbi:hypothetical protein N7493_001327 [Penicillium malachiteum]|uniref:Uncharacterized protein n=1 Tax=Penicillium malachiteum TaxID=1324776 RepID=A0AAD6HU05_9EURO|nr:hypothetical protein N7493_001327 [Penicillium malachiteum]
MVNTLHHLSANRAGFHALWGPKRTSRTPSTEEVYEPMDWAPTNNTVNAQSGWINRQWTSGEKKDDVYGVAGQTAELQPAR